jgi:hypothetical protein
MTTIPFLDALVLLDRAYAIIMEGDADPVAFHLSLDEEEFLKLHRDGPNTDVIHTFLRTDNPEVKINGQMMTLADNSGFHEAVDIKLLVPMNLEVKPAIPAAFERYDSPRENMLEASTPTKK